MTSLAHQAAALEASEEKALAKLPPNASPAVIPPDEAEPDDADEPVDLDNAVQAFRGINIGGDVVTKATADLPEHDRLLIRWIYDRARTLNWNWPRLVEEVGLSQTVWFRVFKGNYVYPSHIPEKRMADGVIKTVKVPHPKAGQKINLENVLKRIERCKRNAEKAVALYSVGFLKTSVWDTIDWACDRAQSKNMIIFLYGRTQIGKTVCLEERTRLHNGGRTTFVRIPPSGGVQGLVKAIARALHVAAKKAHEELLHDVIAALDKSKMLILDEIHEIFIAYTRRSQILCMETLRYIWDRTHCGMILSGTKIFDDAMHDGELRQLLEQLLLRGLQEVRLPDVTPDEDLELALKRYGLPWPKDAQLEEELRHLAAKGFGQVMMRLEDGKDVADKADHPYTWADFTKAQNIIRKMAGKERK